MQLRKARVCLDCEEVHDAQSCPMCASETFAYLTQWLPVEERRKRKRVPEETPSQAPRFQRWILGSGLLGLVAFSIFRWTSRSDPRSLQRAAEEQ